MTFKNQMTYFLLQNTREENFGNILKNMSVFVWTEMFSIWDI